jgi:formylglycine-generating enzyme required for sulfatase activity
MLGNVAEWTLDQYDEKYFEKMSDGAKAPVIPPDKRYPRSVRGGSYLDVPEDMRSANRQHSNSSWNKRDPQIPRSRWWLTDAMFVGFRVVRPLRQPTDKEANAFYDKYLKQ